MILATGLLQSWLHFQLGINLYVLPSLGSWMLLMNLISFGTAGFLLTYYQQKVYQIAFLTGLVATVAAFGGLLFLVLALSNKELINYSTIPLFIDVATGLMYATSLFASRASTRPWLKRAGIMAAILGVCQLATLIHFKDIPPMPVNPTVDSIRQWLSLADRVFPILLIFNFVDEYQQAETRSQNAASLTRVDVAKGALSLLTLCALVLGIRLLGESHAQTTISVNQRTLAQPFDTGKYISLQGDTLFYRLLKPANYNPNISYPLVVGLPYTCWLDNVRQIDACPPAKWLSTPENRRNYPAFIFVPRCPPNTGWGGVANTPSVASLALEAILDLDKTYSIDPHRRYVAGVSRGGYGSWHFLKMHPEMFAAAIPICGEGNPSQAPAMKAVSVWAFHGAKDKNVPVSGSRNMVAALRKAGGHPRYTEYPDAAHNIWEEVVKTPGLLDWLFAQKRANQLKAAKKQRSFIKGSP